MDHLLNPKQQDSVCDCVCISVHTKHKEFFLIESRFQLPCYTQSPWISDNHDKMNAAHSIDQIGIQSVEWADSV